MTLRPVMEHTPVKSSWLSTRRLPNAIFADAAAQHTASEEGAEAAETIGQVAAVLEVRPRLVQPKMRVNRKVRADALPILG